VKAAARLSSAVLGHPYLVLIAEMPMPSRAVSSRAFATIAPSSSGCGYPGVSGMGRAEVLASGFYGSEMPE
jgi:hypothetical protein